jgi:hypothetical protein
MRFIENLFGLSPDNGSGTTEAAMLLALFAVLVGVKAICAYALSPGLLLNGLRFPNFWRIMRSKSFQPSRHARS